MSCGGCNGGGQTPVQKAANFAAAMARAAKAMLVGDPVFVNPEQWKARLAVCVKCEHFQKATAATQPTCGLCGCIVKHKAWLATESCPDNPPRWPH